MILRFVVNGPPVPKARARTVQTKTGRSRSFTPETTTIAINAEATMWYHSI